MAAFAAGPWLDPWPERVAEIRWVLDYGADLDADFLAIYGIDLEVCDMTGPRYLALAHRLNAYQGVMAARVEEEREKPAEPPNVHEAPPDTAPMQQRADGSTEVSLTAFRFQFPGLVSMASSGEEG